MALRNVANNVKKKTQEAVAKAQKVSAQSGAKTQKSGAAGAAKKTGQATGKKVTYYSKKKTPVTNAGRNVKNQVGKAVTSNKKTPTPYQRQQMAKASVKMNQLSGPVMATHKYYYPQRSVLNNAPITTQAGAALYAAQKPGDKYNSFSERYITMAPLEQMKADALAGRDAWASSIRAKSKELSDKEKAKKIVENSKKVMWNKKADRQELSKWDQKNLNEAEQRQIRQAKQRYADAKKADNKADAAKAHREAEALRFTKGYSGGVSGDQYITPELTQAEYNSLSREGELRLKQARMQRQRAVTEEEIARADARIEEILRSPGLREKPATDADTSRGWGYDSEGRRMWAGTREQNRQDAAPDIAALKSLGYGWAGQAASFAETAVDANQDMRSRNNMEQWFRDADDYISAKNDLEYYDNFVKQFGRKPDDMPNRNVLVMRLNNAIQARAQIRRMQTDPRSIYYDPAIAAVQGTVDTDAYKIPGRDDLKTPMETLYQAGERPDWDNPEPTTGDRLLQRRDELQAEALAGKNGLEQKLTELALSLGDSAPKMALSVIPGVGPGLTAASFGVGAAGEKSYELKQRGVPAEERYWRSLLSGGIEAGTNVIPVGHFAETVLGKTGNTALKNIGVQSLEEALQEGASYALNVGVDKLAGDPEARFSLAELAENMLMGAASGAAFGAVGSFIGEGRNRAAMPQVDAIQAKTTEQAAIVTQVQDIVSDERTQEARSLLENTKAYNEMKQTGLYSQDELGMMRDALNERYARLAGVEEVPQTVTQPAPRTLEEAAQQRVASPVVQEAQPVRQTARETVQADLPPLNYERSKFPPSSLLGSLIDAARENNARKQAAEEARAAQAVTREAQRDQASVQVEAPRREARTATQPAGQARSLGAENRTVGNPVTERVDPVARMAATLGDSGAKAMQAAGREVFGNSERLDYGRAFTQVYDQALNGKTQEQIRQPQDLSEPQFYAAVQTGVKDRAANMKRMETVAASATANRNAGLDDYDGYARANLDRDTYRFVDGLARSLGTRVRYAGENGLALGAAGGEITGNEVVIKRGSTKKEIVQRVVGHELTHRMQDVAPTEYRAFRDYVMTLASRDMVDAKLAEYNNAIQEENARRRANGKKELPLLTRDKAMDEIAADYAGDLMVNEASLREFIRKNYTNRTLLERFLDAVRALAAKLTGRERDQAIRSVKLLEDALGAASERVRTMETVKSSRSSDPDMDLNARHSTSSLAAGAGFEAVINEETGMIEFWRNGFKVEHVTAKMLENEGAIGMMIKMARDRAGTISAKQAREQLQGWTDLLNLILKTQDSELVWEFAGAELFSAVKANSDKQYKTTIDFGTICVKTQDMITAMSDSMYQLGRGLTKDEITKLQKKLKLNQATVPCPVCYVFSRWAGVGGLLDNMKKWHYKYLDMTDAEVQNAMRQLERAQTEGARESARADKEYGARYREYEAIAADQSASEEDKKRAKKEMKAIEKIMKRRALSESDEGFHDLMSQAEDLETKIGKISDELKELKRTAKSRRENATEIELKEKSKAKFKERLKEVNAEMKKIEAAGGPELSWLKRVRSKPDYFEKGVFRGKDGKILEGREFDKVIFDLNATERWVTEAPLLWEYRKSRGAGLGKAILPYSDFTFGDLILGDKNNSASGSTTWQKVGKTLTKTQENSYKKARNRLLAQKWMGGQRFQSTSDFRYDYALDYLQAFLELQALGGSIQTYTKVIEFADMVTKIHGDVNMSVMPLGRGYDENGKLIYSDLTGINAEEAIKLRNTTDSAQLILVGINDNHIRLAMQDSEDSGGIYVDFIIPYHPSGASIDQFIAQLVQNLGEDYDSGNYQNYEVVQNDVERDDITVEQARRADLRKKLLTRSEKVGKKARPWSPSEEDMALINRRSKNIRGKSFEELLDIETRALDGDPKAIREYESWSAGVLNNIYQTFWANEDSEYHGVNLSNDQADMIMPNEYWDTKTTRDTAYINGFIFRSLCYSLGLHPRFTGWSSSGRVDHGDFRDQKGYWKTLIDRRMYDRNGKYRRQESINITDISGQEHFDMLTPAYGKEHYGNVRTQQPDTEKALRASDEFVADVQSEEGTRFSISVEEINPVEIRPLNDITDRGKHDYIAKDFAENGWNGRPIVVIDMGNEYAAVTGSHRIFAAQKAGIDTQAVVIDANDDVLRLLNANGDEDRAAVAKELADDGLLPRDIADLIIREDDLNYENWGVDYQEQKRFSMGTGGYDRARLMRENEKLRDRVEYWKGQTKKSDRTKVDPKEVRKLAKKLAGDFSSTMDTAEIAGQLQTIYDGLGKDWTYDQAYEAAHSLAREMVEQASESDGFLYNEYEPLRKFFRENPLVISPEIKRGITDYNDWRKAQMGRLALKNGEQSNIGQIYQEISQLWPEWFDEERDVSSLDKLERIAEVMDGIYTQEETNPFQDDLEGPAGYLTAEIMGSYFDLPAIAKTYADRMAERADARVEKAKGKGREAVQKEKERGAERLRRERERGEQRLREERGRGDYRTAEANLRADWLEAKARREERVKRDAELDNLRRENRERFDNAMRAMREERDARLQIQKEKYLGKEKARSMRQKERELRAKIVRHCGRLSAKLKSGTDKQHIPEVMQRIVATALDSINLGSGFTLVYNENGKAKRVKDGSGETTKRTEAFEDLRKFYQQIITADSDEGLAREMPEIISKIVVSDELPKMIDGIIGLRDTPIANLGKEDLDKIWETVKAIETTISTYDKALGQARFETISEPAFAIQDYVAPKKDRRNYAGAMKHVDRLLNVGMLKPIYFLYRLGDGGKMIWKMIEDAQGTNIRYLDEIRAYQEEHFKPGTAKRLEKKKHTFNFDGQKIELTTAQLINLYNLRKREQAEGHILEGGFRPDQIVKGIRDVTPAAPWHFTAEQIGEMLNVVARDAELVRIADAMMDGIKPQAVHGNAASMEVYGIKKYRERNYWPIESDENQTQTDIKNEAVSKTVAGSGFAKATQKGANNAIILRSAFDVYDDHVVGMAKYAAWLGPLENLRRILNFRYKDETGHFGSGVKEMLTKIIGKDGPGYYKKLMDDLNAGIKATSDNPFQQFIGSYKAAAVAGNIRVVAQQPTSIMRALAEIDPQDFLLGMAEARPGQWENEIKKYAPIAIWKDWGYFTADTGRQMRNIFWGDDNILQTTNNFIMNNRAFSPGAADAVTWTAIWNAVKRETKRTRKDLNPDAEEFKYAVRDRFNEVINLTQVVDGIPQRSQLMRSENDVTKMATSFMGEPTTTYNMASYALHNVRTSTGAERGKAMRDLARATMALASSIVLVAAAQSLVDAMRDDDKDEGYWEKFFQALYGWEGDTRKDRIKSAILNGNLGAGMNPLTYIPFIKDVVSKRQGYKVTRMDMDIISRVMDSYDAVVKAMNGEGKKTRKNAWINFIAECSRFLGIPVANIKRDILSGASTVFRATGNYRYQYEMEKFLYNIEGTGNFSEFAKLAYLAKRDGDTEAYEAIRADLIANGPKSEKDVDKKIAEFEKKAVTDTAEYQTELANLSDSYATMLESNATFQAMDAEQQDKARTTMANYAEYQVLGDRIEVDNSQMENLSSIESQGMNPADWVVFKTQFDTLHSDKDANGKDIPGQKKQDKAIKLIDETFETDEEKCAAYRTVYDSDANNPWK